MVSHFADFFVIFIITNIYCQLTASQHLFNSSFTGMKTKKTPLNTEETNSKKSRFISRYYTAIPTFFCCLVFRKEIST